MKNNKMGNNLFLLAMLGMVLIQALLAVEEIIVKQDFVPSYEGTII